MKKPVKRTAIAILITGVLGMAAAWFFRGEDPKAYVKPVS